MLSADHAALLEAQAVDLGLAAAAGVYSVLSVDELPAEFASYGEQAVPALAFPWRSPSGVEVVQLRPDTPIPGPKPRKYLWPKDVSSVLGEIRRDDDSDQVLIVEGTKQSLAVASVLPYGSVYGVAGCRSWSTGGVPLADLAVAAGKAVTVCFDADIASNLDVWVAGQTIRDALEAEGAASVAFLLVPAGAKTGLDDVLGARPRESRRPHLERLLAAARTKLGGQGGIAKPKARRGSQSPYFGPGGLLVATLSKAVLASRPALLTPEHKVAVYSGGAYALDGSAFIGALAELLGEDYRPAHRAAVEEFTVGVLRNTGAILPSRTFEPLVNLTNGMLDLRTGELVAHDPAHASVVQLPVDWDPDAKARVYEDWLAEVVGEQADDLEEVASVMLDPSRTPSKAVFLFGPARSGKSTFLRLLAAMAGAENVSGVSLDQLSRDRFAAANVYGKILNVSADLSARHVDDLSVFKLMTGEDLINADRKYGRQFSFTNRALFAFSANELPTVGESTRAYAERVKPFRFGRSFAGSEDPEIEAAMMRELPGVLRRWVAAYRRLTARRGYAATAPDVAEEFETRSDRVRQWVAEELVVVASGSATAVPAPGQLVEPDLCSTPTELSRLFNQWAKENGGAGMGRNKITARLTSINGVVEVRNKATKARALNLVPRGPEVADVAEVAVIALKSVSEKRRVELISSTEASYGPELPLVPQVPLEPETGTNDPDMSVMPEPDPIQEFEAYGTTPAMPCETCGAAMDLVPPARFWYACRSCHPATFERN